MMNDYVYPPARVKVSYPPKPPKDIREVASFADVLLEIIPTKLEEHLAAMDKLVEEYEELRVIITREQSLGHLNDFSLWFWVYFMEVSFAPYTLHQKWINYWLDLYEQIPNAPVTVNRTVTPTYSDSKYDLERIKENRLIEDFYTGELRKSANRLLGKCPFHEEKSGSFFIFDDNHFHCFSCHEHGDVIAFIMKLKEMDFKSAVEFLK